MQQRLQRRELPLVEAREASVFFVNCHALLAFLAAMEASGLTAEIAENPKMFNRSSRLTRR